MRGGVEALARGDRELVVDPALLGYQSQASLSSVGMFTSAGRPRTRNIAGARDRLRRSAWESRIASRTRTARLPLRYVLRTVLCHASRTMSSAFSACTEKYRRPASVQTATGNHPACARQRSEGFRACICSCSRCGWSRRRRNSISAAGNAAPSARRLAGEMHLDASALGIIERMVAEACEVEVAAELAIDAGQQIEVEPRGDAGGVVIGGVENRRLLHQIDADDHGARRGRASCRRGAGTSTPRAARNCRWSSLGKKPMRGMPATAGGSGTAG